MEASLPAPGRAWLALERLEAIFDHAFGQRLNPLRHLGALGFLAFWTCSASGIWIYVAFDTSATGAWQSVAALDRGEWPLGAFARALHRYSADAMALVVAIHLLREWARRHYATFRRFAWITGVVLLVPLLASGIGGYWLPWDRMAQWSLTATTEWLDALPPFDGALTRNVIGEGQVNDRLFSLFIFLHIGLPLLLLATMWTHIQRVSPARTQPPRALALGTLAALAALSAVRPLELLPPADLGLAAARLPVDWFYLFVHPAMEATGAPGLWAVAIAVFGALLAAPWLTRARRAPAARVSLADCNGCARCFADCPFGAVAMVARSDGRPHPREARVDPDACAGCGICTGACPSSTPFRSGEALVTGIDMPSLPIGALRARLERATAALSGSPRLVVFGCRWAADVEAIARADTAAIPFLCAAMVPPSFVEYALRGGADGVLLVGCREGDCEFRVGADWTRERLAGARAPALRDVVPRERVRLAWAGRTDGARLRAACDDFREALRHPEAGHRPAALPGTVPKRLERHHG